MVNVTKAKLLMFNTALGFSELYAWDMHTLSYVHFVPKMFCGEFLKQKFTLISCRLMILVYHH